MTQPRLSTFAFDVVTVDAQGQETSRTRGQAQSFTEDLGNGIGLDMVLVPGGSFVMGSPETEAGSEDSERPQHLVRVSPFFMGKYAVTQAQCLMVSQRPKVNHDLDLNVYKAHNFEGLQRPVDCITWWQAVEFCDRLSTDTGRPYRLPSEAEWEYACRAGTTTPFYFGETLPGGLANFEFPPTDRSRFPPNAFGLHNMHGNIWE